MKNCLRVIFVCATLAASLPAAAWEIQLRPDAAGVSQVWAGNASPLAQVQPYLLWHDQDSGEFRSWLNNTWQAGIAPLLGHAFDIPALPMFELANSVPVCPSGHRCLLGLVAVPAGKPFLSLADWQAASLLPLTPDSARQRLPGQNLFMQADNSTSYSRDLLAGQETVFANDSCSTCAATPPTATTPAATEKPDIFRLQGHQLLYANAQAGRFQVVDTSDPAQPKLTLSLPLAGTPREIYSLNGSHILLQDGNNIARLTVLQPDAAGQWQVAQEWTTPGSFQESRRRGELIYAVVMNYQNSINPLEIHALRMASDGKIAPAAKFNQAGYSSPKVAIFPDHLVIASPAPVDWNSSEVRVFDLSKPDAPLQDLGAVRIAGQLPSEFHMDARDGQLRLVYAPWGNSASSVGVYDLTRAGMPLLGEITGIAPGESLFAARFAGDMAYLVTYLRTDPLWVVDLSNPAKPALRGELHVPGWSEKMFFHGNKLFAVGIDDQPAPGQSWARRLSLSLFDVADPLNPKLLSRVTPLADKVSYSTSPALEDERALLLDWEQGFAAVPLETWETENGSSLQAVTITDTGLSDAGRLQLGVPAQRSMSLGADLVGVLSEQTFLTAQWQNADPKVLGEVELARNLTWLAESGTELIAAAQGQNGYHRLYRYNPADLENSLQTLALSHAYQGVVADGEWVVFYSQSPLVAQAAHVPSGKVYPAKTLDFRDNPANTTSWYYSHSTPLLKDGVFYVARQVEMPVEAQAGLIAPSPRPSLMWRLESWKITDTGWQPEASRSIPGIPLAVQGKRLITQESSYDSLTQASQTRLNLLQLEPHWATLLDSVSTCYLSSALWDGQAVFFTCSGPMIYYAAADVASTSVMPPIQADYALRRIAVADRFLPEQSWKFDSYRSLRAVAGDTVVFGDNAYYWADARYTTGLYSPSYTPSCEVMRLSGDQAVSLAKIADCPWFGGGMVLKPGALYSANGYRGLRKDSW